MPFPLPPALSFFSFCEEGRELPPSLHLPSNGCKLLTDEGEEKESILSLFNFGTNTNIYLATISLCASFLKFDYF